MLSCETRTSPDAALRLNNELQMIRVENEGLKAENLGLRKQNEALQKRLEQMTNLSLMQVLYTE